MSVPGKWVESQVNKFEQVSSVDHQLSLTGGRVSRGYGIPGEG